MRGVRIIAVAMVYLTASAYAQQGWQELISRDLVVIEEDKMILESFSLDRISVPGYEPLELQVGYHSEAPSSGFISRDNFVAFTSVITASLIQGIFAEAFDIKASEFFAGYESREISQPIGEPDLEIRVTITGEGYQIEIANTNTNEKSKFTDTWESLFKDQ